MTVMEADVSVMLSAQVAAEIRAWMGRLEVRQSELARRLGETDQWLSMRLKGRTPIDLNELQRIAAALGIGIGRLLPSDLDDAGVGRTVVIAGEPRVKTTRAYPHVTDQPTPAGHPKRTGRNPSTRRPVRLR